MHYRDSGFLIDKCGSVDSIRYLYTPPSPYKKRSFLGRRLSNLLGRINELMLLIRLGIKGKIHVILYYPGKGALLRLILLRIYSKIFSVPLVAQYVEYRSVLGKEEVPYTKWLEKLYDRHFQKFVDGVIPISNFLIEQLKINGPTKEFIKIPPVADFDMFDQLTQQRQVPYFLYVGSAGYMEAINLVLDSFAKIDNSHFYLYLLINGTPQEMIEVKKVIESNKKYDQIRSFFKSKL